jgi:Mn2+/Fe2+ NRAMP family transporter
MEAPRGETLPAEVLEPPETIWATLGHLGPGLIVAGSIVGSGELIATTLTGAEAGFWLLWVIVVGCMIKVFVQVELGRYSIATGQTTMTAMASVPGPVVSFFPLGEHRGPQVRGNWLLWYWLAMFVVGIGQLGGIVGGVGQALAITAPLTEEGRKYNEAVERLTRERIDLHEAQAGGQGGSQSPAGEVRADRRELLPRGVPAPRDHMIWAAIVTVITSVVLVLGRYALIQSFSTAMVATFTAITVVNLVALQAQPFYAISLAELEQGMQFRLPPRAKDLNGSPLATALATFGIIGVGASELIAYPYWCLEKGYARHTGAAMPCLAWSVRAIGWLRVMRIDAWCSMFFYTFATVAFYLLGAAILGRIHLRPEGSEMIRTLAIMYEPVFGRYAQMVFLFGSFAVLYSTFFVASAANARVFSDALRVMGLGTISAEGYWLRVRWLSGALPFLSLFVYVCFPQPTRLVLASGVMQALMLPMLSGAAIYFRYRRCDPRIAPGRLWDVCLWVSAMGMLLAGIWLSWSKLAVWLGWFKPAGG